MNKHTKVEICTSCGPTTKEIAWASAWENERLCYDCYMEQLEKEERDKAETRIE